MKDIQILMATYNGEKHVAGQIESILNQTNKDWMLLIRDDGSTDKTVGIIKSYVKSYPDKIFLLEDNEERSGIVNNFSRLIMHSQSKYIMLSDQDDIWFSDKVELTLQKMKEIERQKGSTAPILIHTDLIVVDNNLEVVNHSFWGYQKFDPESKTLNRLIVQNAVMGCTIMMNKALRAYYKPVSEDVIMHDWWLGILAAGVGTIDHLNMPTMLYRQHGKNSVGAKKWGIKFILKTFAEMKRLNERLRKTQKQAGEFLNKYRLHLNFENIEKLETYSNLYNNNFVKRRYLVLKHSFYKVGFVRNIGLILFI